MADAKPVHEKDTIIALVVAFFLLFSILLWISFSKEISSGVRWIRVGQMEFISLFTSQNDQMLEQIKKLRPEDIKPMYLFRMSEVTGEFFKLPIAIITGIMATLSFFRKSKHIYSRKLNLEAVVKEQATAFPVTMPITKFNPLQHNHRTYGSALPEKLPPFAEAMTPHEWVSFHNIPRIEGVVDADAARRAFAKQLSGRWQGSAELPWYAKALFVAFSMKANNMRTESDEFLGRIANCWQPDKGLVLTAGLRKEIWQKLQDPKFGRITEKIAAQHAFAAPAMLRCLHIAREQGGVLAPAQFLWLRAVDRTLWYPLNNLGRGSVHVEAAGAMAHYRTERAAGKPIPNPQVDIAVEGLKTFLLESGEINFPAREFAKS